MTYAPETSLAGARRRGRRRRNGRDDARLCRDPRVARGCHDPLDDDDSLVPGEIVAKAIRLRHPTQHEEKDLGEGLRWSYGPIFGIWHVLLRRKLDEPLASVAFGATLMGAMLTLFPLLGHTPPPWRWGPAVQATCVATHVAYVVTAAAVAMPQRLSASAARRLRRGRRPRRRRGDRELAGQPSDRAVADPDIERPRLDREPALVVVEAEVLAVQREADALVLDPVPASPD